MGTRSRVIRWQRQEAAADQCVLRRAIERRRARRLEHPQPGHASVTLDRELQIHVAPEAHQDRLRHDPVPVHLVLEVVDPGREVGAAGIEEQWSHPLPGARRQAHPTDVLEPVVQVAQRLRDRRPLELPVVPGLPGASRTGQLRQPEPVGTLSLVSPLPPLAGVRAARCCTQYMRRLSTDVNEIPR